MKKVILASSSPRRIEILSLLGIPFEAIVPDIDETHRPSESPKEYVQRLAIEKAQKVAKSNAITIGGDITVNFNNTTIGKATNREEAFKTLHMLSNKTHQVHNGFAILDGEEIIHSGVNDINVTFNDLTDEMINEYLDNENWSDKAGYGIQGGGMKLIKEIDGGYFDMLGFAIFDVAETLNKLGFTIDQDIITELKLKHF